MTMFSNAHPMIMGILNVTPDSFSDGGQFKTAHEAIIHAKQMAEDGADIIDVGGESTRPGSERVSATEQKQRVLDIVAELRQSLPGNVVISIDTTLADVAESAIEAGARMINDISAGRDDPGIVNLAVEKDCPYIVMHMQGSPKTMQDEPEYSDVVREVKDFLLLKIGEISTAGIKKENIIIDPGIGFGKTREHNLELMANLKEFVDTGYPVLLGASRKRFMDSVCQRTASELDGATCATTVIGVNAGVKIFRVHNVRLNCQAADIAWTIKNKTFDEAVKR